MTPESLEKKFDFLAQRSWAKEFFDFRAEDFEKMLRTKDEKFWQSLGERRALSLFKNAARRVPAYRNFLKKNGVRSNAVKTIQDFRSLPITTKENYVSQYALSDRSWDGQVSENKLIAASSGTTGDPKYWPRGGFQDFEAAVIHELLYRSFFDAHRKRTLFLIGFPMGVYVSGVATLLPTWLAANKFANATVMSIGNNKGEMIRSLSRIADNFDVVVLIGHPFFIKDIIETGKKENIKWKNMDVRLMFCSEGVSEAWRDHIVSELGGNVKAIISTYGSSEFLLMGWETPLSIAFRRTLNAASGVAPDIFQYNPLHRFIESVDGELIFTSASGIPLIRYNLRDAGEVASFSDVASHITKTALKSAAWQLPFVALSGRSDQAVVFYAANIYPEHIKIGINAPIFFKQLTGKFTMRKDYLRNMDEFLEINIELRPDIRPHRSLVRRIQASIVQHLELNNMEYKFLRQNLDKNIVPKVRLWPYGHAKYFKPGLKPRYILAA